MIKLSTPDSYEQIASIINLTAVNAAVTADQLHAADERRNPKCQAGYLIAEVDSHILGYASYTQYADLYDPYRFWVMVRVHPVHQRRGIGTKLFHSLLETLQSLDAKELRVQLREDQTVSIAFAQKFGFTVYHKRWMSVLDVHEIDLSAWEGYEARLQENDIRLVSFAELASDPAHEEKVHALQNQIDVEVPIGDEFTPLSLEEFRQQFIGREDFVREGTFIALHGDEYIGLSTFFDMGDSRLEIDLTGVLPDYRRKGVARALKLKGIAYAQAAGYHYIAVVNDDGNNGMIAINRELGFERQPALLQFRRAL